MPDNSIPEAFRRFLETNPFYQEDDALPLPSSLQPVANEIAEEVDALAASHVAKLLDGALQGVNLEALLTGVEVAAVRAAAARMMKGFITSAQEQDLAEQARTMQQAAELTAVLAMLSARLTGKLELGSSIPNQLLGLLIFMLWMDQLENAMQELDDADLAVISEHEGLSVVADILMNLLGSTRELRNLMTDYERDPRRAPEPFQAFLDYVLEYFSLHGPEFPPEDYDDDMLDDIPFDGDDLNDIPF
ncbi:MAG: hypothetical protein Kow0077_14770 [Anaerolineae bacterium]